MTIEVIVGLPHLNEGPILQRARLMQQPMLISANCLSRWRTASGGWREWHGWRTGQLGNAHGLKSLDLDSAGYVLMARYGGYPWSIADYMALAASYPFRRFAAADYCCEAQIAADRAEVLDRIARTGNVARGPMTLGSSTASCRFSRVVTQRTTNAAQKRWRGR